MTHTKTKWDKIMYISSKIDNITTYNQKNNTTYQTMTQTQRISTQTQHKISQNNIKSHKSIQNNTREHIKTQNNTAYYKMTRNNIK